jgi:hypothetical protein
VDREGLHLMAKLTLKLPQPFIDKHKALIEGYDWRSNEKMVLGKHLPDVPELADVVLEVVVRGALTIIKSVDLRSMTAVRKYSDALAKAAEAA